MIPASVGVVGYNQIGKRVADAIRAEPGLQLAGVYERDSRRYEVIRARQIPLVSEALEAWAASCAVVVVCEPILTELATRTVFATLESRLPYGLHVPCADALAFVRLLSCLSPVERLFSSCARRSNHVDALEPLFELTAEDADLERVLARFVESHFIRRVSVPYTRSHLHHLKLDLCEPMSRDAALDALRHAPRVRLAAGADSFSNTGLMQEFDRDLGRSRGDRPEVFVWEESVQALEHSLYMTVDVDPDATPVPDILDAVRLFVRSHARQSADDLQ